MKLTAATLTMLCFFGCAQKRAPVVVSPALAAVAAAAGMPPPWTADANDPYNACLVNLANAALRNVAIGQALANEKKSEKQSHAK